MPDESYGRHELLSFDDNIWARIRAVIPQPIEPEAEARLRTDIMDCCSWLRTQGARLGEGKKNAKAVQRPNKGQLSERERLAKGLRMAADAWTVIGGVHEDRLGFYKNLEAMAQEQECRLAQEPAMADDPWPMFVRKVAHCCRQAGLTIKRTGRVYENAKLPWFQKLMATIQSELLGKYGKPSTQSPQAFAAAITHALRGDGK